MKANAPQVLVLIMFFAVSAGSAEPIPSVQEIGIIPSSSVLVPIPGQNIQTTEPAPLTGIASWYSESDPAINRHTANGEIFDDTKMACASWDFPFGARLKITSLHNGKSVVCVVNDRGPAKHLRRLVDLTLGAFREIADPRMGLVEVSVTAVSD